MDTPPQVIKVKRRYNEEPLQSLIVESNRHRKKVKLPARSTTSNVAPESYIFRLSRTEGLGEASSPTRENGRSGIPTVRSTVLAPPPATRDTATFPPVAASTITAMLQPQQLSLATPPTVPSPAPGAATPSKRKGAPESPLATTSNTPLAPQVDFTPPTPGPTTTTTPIPHIHSHPPGGKENANLLQVPQPRKFHLIHRISQKAAKAGGAFSGKGISPVRSSGSPRKSAVFIEGVGLGNAATVTTAGGLQREKKRRRRRKEEVRLMSSRESLNAAPSVSALVVPTSVSTRKRPKVHPREKAEMEERKRKLVGGDIVPKISEMGVQTGKGEVESTAQVQPSFASIRGRNRHRHPEVSAADNVDNDDGELSKALQQMVLEYLSAQEGITNLTNKTPMQQVREKQSRNKTLADKIGGGVGGVGGGTWESVDKGQKADDDGITGTEEESGFEDEDEEEGWVYDVYVREKVLEVKKMEATGSDGEGDGTGLAPGVAAGEYGVLVLSDPEDEEWFYQGGREDEETDGDGVLSDDEDSNAEDYYTNEYPDEDEVDDELLNEFTEGYLYGDEYGGEDDYSYGSDRRRRTARNDRGVNYLRELGFEYAGDDDDYGDEYDVDDGSDLYESVFAGRKHKPGGVRRYAPGEEEFDLNERTSSDEDDEGEATRMRLQRGVWGLGTAKAGNAGLGKNPGASALDKSDNDEVMD